MPFDPFERVAVGRTALRVTRLGFGAASIGGLFHEVTDADAAHTIEHAWEIGVRSFDVAPLYGYGNAERRLGAVLSTRPRDAFVLSTKVGRLVLPSDAIGPDDEVDHQAKDDRDDAFYAATEGRRLVFDFSYEGVLRSVEASLERLGLARIDVLYLHDPDRHWQQAMDGAYPALERLRSDGVVGAIGAGMNQSAMLERFARETDMDVFLLAGRYTLLDQDALATLLPVCLDRGIAVMIGGVMNSGILAGEQGRSLFDYTPAPDAIVERSRRIAAVCDRHGVPLRAAAIQFPLAHPAVTALIAGVRSPGHLDDYPAFMRSPIPTALWDDLRAESLIAAEAPTPA
jgi:D-threo-aldose 1-dehydrogenase